MIGGKSAGCMIRNCEVITLHVIKSFLLLAISY